ncbi:MAG TPA: hypothetical protein PLV12_05275 [Saprospiraceae bacterium]|mgnify:FL=1|nr:hypothetical protein [Saprospiraceae bacterium]HRG65193.1 hypothetical protein [Saprospiraceae bacterium]
MKRTVFILFLGWLFALTGCTGDDREYIERKLNLSFNVPAGLNNIESHYFRIDDVYLFLDETLEINKLDTSSIDEISGGSARLFSRLGGVDFSDIERISIFAVSQTDKNNRKEMFYLEEIPLRNLDELKLLNGLADFSEFIEDNRLDIEVRIQFRRFSTLSMQLDLDFSYLIFKK